MTHPFPESAHARYVRPVPQAPCVDDLVRQARDLGLSWGLWRPQAQEEGLDILVVESFHVTFHPASRQVRTVHLPDGSAVELRHLTDLLYTAAARQHATG